MWRVGYRADPWAWTPVDVRDRGGGFPGRWDDPAGDFKTVYAMPEPQGQPDAHRADQEQQQRARYPCCGVISSVV